MKDCMCVLFKLTLFSEVPLVVQQVETFRHVNIPVLRVKSYMSLHQPVDKTFSVIHTNMLNTC